MSVEELISWQLRSNLHLYGRRGLVYQIQVQNPEIQNWRRALKQKVVFPENMVGDLLVIVEPIEKAVREPHGSVSLTIHKTLSHTVVDNTRIDRNIEISANLARQRFPDFNWDEIPAGQQFFIRLGQKENNTYQETQIVKPIPQPAKNLNYKGKSSQLAFFLNWSPAKDLESQNMQIYSGENCDQPLGPPIPLSEDQAEIRHKFKKNGFYTFRIQTRVQGEDLPSDCSPPLKVDASIFKKATQLRFKQGSWTEATTITARWKPILLKSVEKQIVIMYKGEACEEEVWESGSLPRSDYILEFDTEEEAGSYTFKVVSSFNEGDDVASDCSQPILVDPAVETIEL